jgi:hypothetical protein
MLPARAEKHGRIVEAGGKAAGAAEHGEDGDDQDEDFLESGEIDRPRPGWIGFRPDGV